MTDLHRLSDSQSVGLLTVLKKQYFWNVNIGQT